MTMTAKRLAELDSVMAKATPNEWAAKMWDSPYKIGIWAKDGADYKTCTPIATGRAKAPDKRLLDELHLIAYEREQVPIVEANIAAIVALHNAYPDLRAHIEAQAATLGFQDGFVMITVMFVLTLIPAWILGRAKPRDASDEKGD